MSGLLLTGIAFQMVDREPTQRQLHEIAELDKNPERATCSPRFMRLTVHDDQPMLTGENEDFRDEVLNQIYDRGNPDPQRSLTFNIQVTDKGRSRGRVMVRRSYEDWRKIGQIEFTEAVASYNSDFVFHIPHPKWRAERNG